MCISGLSESIRWILSPVSIQVSFRPLKNLKQEYVHPKDPVPLSKRKGVVYSIPCAQCPAPTLDRLGGHWTCTYKNIIKLSRRKMSLPPLSQGMCLKRATQVYLSKTSVIDYDPHTQTCCLLESWHIPNHQAPLNRGKGPCRVSMQPTGLTSALPNHF